MPGDNVGDVAGMGSDLFGSFAKATCTALVVGSSIGVSGGWDAILPSHRICCRYILFSFLICSFHPAKSKGQVQLISTTALMIPAVYSAAIFYLPALFQLHAAVRDKILTLSPLMATSCVCMGTIGGLIIGLVTEYYTSHYYPPAMIAVVWVSSLKKTSLLSNHSVSAAGSAESADSGS
jgi:Na+/H+-translocating membrane pyrophosphatase